MPADQRRISLRREIRSTGRSVGIPVADREGELRRSGVTSRRWCDDLDSRTPPVAPGHPGSPRQGPMGSALRVDRSCTAAQPGRPPLRFVDLGRAWRPTAGGSCRAIAAAAASSSTGSGATAIPGAGGGGGSAALLGNDVSAAAARPGASPPSDQEVDLPGPLRSPTPRPSDRRGDPTARPARPRPEATKASKANFSNSATASAHQPSAGSSSCGGYPRHRSEPPTRHGDGSCAPKPRPCSPWTSSTPTAR